VIDDQEDANNKTLSPYPTVQRLSGNLAEDHSAVEFEESLEELLNRIALMQAQSSS
jgi:hypothetical protein